MCPSADALNSGGIVWCYLYICLFLIPIRPPRSDRAFWGTTIQWPSAVWISLPRCMLRLGLISIKVSQTDRQNDEMSAYLHSLLHVILCPFYNIRLITYQCIKISPVPIKGLKVMIMRCIKPKNRKKRIFDNEIEQMNKKQGLLYAFRTTVYCIGLLLKLELDQCLLFYIR